MDTGSDEVRKKRQCIGKRATTAKIDEARTCAIRECGAETPSARPREIRDYTRHGHSCCNVYHRERPARASETERAPEENENGCSRLGSVARDPEPLGPSIALSRSALRLLLTENSPIPSAVRDATIANRTRRRFPNTSKRHEFSQVPSRLGDDKIFHAAFSEFRRLFQRVDECE